MTFYSGFVPNGLVGGTFLGSAQSITVVNTRTVAQNAPYNAIIIQSFKDDQTAPLANFPQLPYLYATGVAMSLGSPGPTDNQGATNYAFWFPAGLNFWCESPSNGDNGNLFWNANGDGTTHQFPWITGRTSTSMGMNAGASSAAALTMPNDAASAPLAWFGAGTTPPFNIRLFLAAGITGETSLLIKGIASQTGLFTGYETSGGTIISGVGPDGGFLVGNNSTAITASSPGLYGGTGAPSNTLGANGSYYIRADGGVNTHFYFKSGGAWAAMTAF